MRISIPLIASLVLLLSAASGCRQEHGQSAPSFVTPDKTQGSKTTAEDTPSGPIPQEPKGHTPSASSEFTKPPDNPLVRGLSEMLKTSKFDELDEDGQLRRNLQEADSLLTRIKKENFEALRQANRQVRRPGARSPNIILIVADELAPNALGCYGQRMIQTPHIDALAKQGMRFTHFKAASPYGAASRWSIMTGRHIAQDQPIGPHSVDLKRQETTLAETLWQAGYRTAFIGRWGLTTLNVPVSPIEHGYDDWLGFLDEAEAGNQFPEFLWRKGERLRFTENADGKKSHDANDLFTKVATTFLKQHPRNRPFFLHLAYTIPHPNLIVPSDAPYAEKDWSQLQKHYAAMVSRLDRRIGDIQTRLEQLQLDKNTIIIFTSENAPHTLHKNIAAFFTRNESLDRTSSSSRLRVPFIVCWPGHVSPGSVTHHASSFCDLAPTLADIVEANHRPIFSDGVSLLSIF